MRAPASGPMFTDGRESKGIPEAEGQRALPSSGQTAPRVGRACGCRGRDRLVQGAVSSGGLDRGLCQRPRGQGPGQRWVWMDEQPF